MSKTLRFVQACLLSKRSFVIAVLLAVLIWLGRPTPPAAAHPLGNFSINRYSRITLSNEVIYLFYVLDMAEIPTFQTQAEMDHNEDGRIDEVEQSTFRDSLVATLTENLNLLVNDTSQPLSVTTSRLVFPPGQGNLPTLRLEVEFAAALPTASAWNIHYRDGNYPDRLGWQEIVVDTAAGQLLSGYVTSQDVSQALTQYPVDLLQNPLTVQEVTFQFAAATGTVAAVSIPEAAIAPEDRFSPDRFAELIAIEEWGIGVIVTTFAAAFGLGALHALSPGHGKTIVGAYLVGSRGTARHALFLGLTTTLTHTAGVFVFGLLVLFASRFILPEQLYPWLGVLSGLLVVLIGASLLRQQWHKQHDQAHDHSQETSYHTHFGVGHSHVPAQHTGKVTWLNLLALGISGGLLPCPSALVVLLGAIALERVGLGLVLILFFSLGLATVLTSLGIALVYASRLFERLPTRSGHLLRFAPVLSATFITLAGIGITVKALLEAKIL